MSPDAGHPCTQGGCTSHEGAPCEYVDRRGRECRTAWCPEHRVTIEDRVYCRRHAGVVSALPSLDSSLSVSLPDLDNRAPSLVGWVSRQIDGDVWRLLLKELSSGSGGQLIADPVTLIFVGIGLVGFTSARLTQRWLRDESRHHPRLMMEKLNHIEHELATLRELVIEPARIYQPLGTPCGRPESANIT